jgi:hypothetical protein
LTISQIKNSGATAIVIAKNQIMLIHAQKKAMKIITKSLSLLLALTTSVCAETIDLHIQNTNKFTPRMLPSQEYFGSECATRSKVLNFDDSCDRVIVTGANDPSLHLNFHFVDRNNVGYMYLTERTGRKDVDGTIGYAVIGISFEKNNQFGEMHTDLNPLTSVCILNRENLKFLCAAQFLDGATILSGLSN